MKQCAQRSQLTFMLCCLLLHTVACLAVEPMSNYPLAEQPVSNIETETQSHEIEKPEATYENVDDMATPMGIGPVTPDGVYY